MQVLVIGAGVIGLAVARTAAQAGHEVTVAEMTGGIANGVSSRNSEVIHAGLYYPTDSLRARHCVRGRRMLYAFCASHDVPHRKCGKLVVATNAAELAKVETIHDQAQINGVEGTEMIGGNAARAMEGELSCIGARKECQSQKRNNRQAGQKYPGQDSNGSPRPHQRAPNPVLVKIQQPSEKPVECGVESVAPGKMSP